MTQFSGQTMTERVVDASSPIGLIAAGGVMPFAVADSLTARGVNPVLFALKGACDPVAVQRFRHHWISLETDSAADAANRFVVLQVTDETVRPVLAALGEARRGPTRTLFR